MILNRIGFDYDIKKQGFESLSYDFVFEPEVIQAENFSIVAKEKLLYLEKLLSNNFFNEKYEKEQDGSISSSQIDIGFSYRGLNVIRKGFLRKILSHVSNNDSASLKFNYTNFGGLNRLSLDLRTSSDNQIILLNTYDAVLATPDLLLSQDAQVQVYKIDSLRRNKFNAEKSLDALLTSK